MNNIEIKSKEKAIEWIHSLKTLGIKPGLKRMEWMLQCLGNPERRLKFIHVAGTNGKGSTVSFISKVLQKAGYRVGIFTSPYLIDFTNRIQVNGEDINGEDLVEAVNAILPLAGELAETELGAPTEFEVITTIAIIYFASKAHPDVVVWEAGLGGRLDSTNVVMPIVSVITNVGHDHMNLLGNEIKDIAKEKAGIIKSGIPVISGIEDSEALMVIKETAKAKKANLYQINEQFYVKIDKINEQGSEIEFKDPYITMPNIEIKLLGPHQTKNAAVALMTLEILRQFYAFYIEESTFYSGMKSTFWPGRMEIISENPYIIIDGAHNPEGAKSLSEAISLFNYDRLILVTGILSDKAIGDFYQPLLPLADELIVTEPVFPRAAKVEEVVNIIKSIDKNKQIIEQQDWQQAVNRAISIANNDDLILITGSLYMISDVRRFLLGKNNQVNKQE